MKTKQATKAATNDNRPFKQAVEHAWMQYDIAMKTNKSTAKCMELHRAWKVLHAERYGV